jgi:hypothetical protein
VPTASWQTWAFAILLVPAGLAFFDLTARNELRARALDESGVVTIARVTRLVEDPDTDAGERLEYALAAGGNTYEGQSRHLDRATLEQARATQTIEVRYLPSDPSVSAPTHAATRRTQVAAFVFSGLVLLAGLGALFVGISTRMRTGRFAA